MTGGAPPPPLSSWIVDPLPLGGFVVGRLGGFGFVVGVLAGGFVVVGFDVVCVVVVGLLVVAGEFPPVPVSGVPVFVVGLLLELPPPPAGAVPAWRDFASAWARFLAARSLAAVTAPGDVPGASPPLPPVWLPPLPTLPLPLPLPVPSAVVWLGVA